jgi:hypothetical protein
MRTAIIIAAGFVFLALFVYGGRLAGRPGPEAVVLGAKVFIAAWFVAAAANMAIGVLKAGYTVMDELPIFLLIFALPAAVAGFVWWKYS